MHPEGSRWRKTRDQFRANCARKRLPCHICRQPIDYTLRPRRGQYIPGAFEYDHIIPVSIRPDLAEVVSNGAPSHAKCNRARQAEKIVDWVTPSW